MVFSKKSSSLKIGNTGTYCLTGRDAGQGLKIGTVSAKTGRMAAYLVDIKKNITNSKTLIA